MEPALEPETCDCRRLGGGGREEIINDCRSRMRANKTSHLNNKVETRSDGKCVLEPFHHPRDTRESKSLFHVYGILAMP